MADIAVLRNSEMIRVCAGEKETHVHRDKYLLDVFPCFA